MKRHQYKTKTEWTGNSGSGTASYQSYSRDHLVSAEGKQVVIPASSDPSFLGDHTRYNPEELFLSSLSSCHMLWYLHMCTVNGVVVTGYTDHATGTMLENEDGSGRFTEVILNPEVTVSHPEMIEKAAELHHKANEMCFIANSCNFPVRHQPVIKVPE
jgi:organic hydroperoxide reductase OsmC/OhrA